MLGKAMAAVPMALTTLLVFMVVAVGRFLSGFPVGVVYACSFVVIQLRIWTLATQTARHDVPAMVKAQRH
jgi:site-specific recombinase